MASIISGETNSSSSVPSFPIRCNSFFKFNNGYPPFLLPTPQANPRHSPTLPWIYFIFATINNQKEVVDKYIFAIRLYSSAYFRFINTYLREQGTIINEITTKRGKKLSLNETQIKSWAKCLQYALTSYKIIDKNIEDNTIVYRGIKKNKFPKNMGIGSSFFCSEFISTSLKEEFSLNWIEGEGTLLKITIRNNGTNGYSKYCQFIDSISVSNKPPQNEVLIASNCFYRITNIIRQKKIDYVALICEGLLI